MIYCLDVNDTKQRHFLLESIDPLGGSVDVFLNKSVNCVITDGKAQVGRISLPINARSHRIMKLSKRYQTSLLFEKATTMGIKLQ